MRVLDASIQTIVTDRLEALEKHFDGDVAFFYGALQPGVVRFFRDFVERLAATEPQRSRLVMVLNSPGGSAEVAEKMVEIIRFHYSEIFFVVPDYALSAGTIFCMAGDKIFMDYSSSLGPIDPQVFTGTEWVPALGYLDKVEELLEKARKGELTNAEFVILQNQDLARLSRYEQARDLTVTLLKRWLVEYKFRDWSTHKSDPDKVGQAVTLAEKEERAEQIARLLGDNQLWHSHGRMISATTLQSVLKLEIDDYSAEEELRNQIRMYNDLLTEYIARNGFEFFMNSREYF